MPEISHSNLLGVRVEFRSLKRLTFCASSSIYRTV